MSGHASLKAAFRRQVMNLYFEGTLKPSEKSVLMTLATFLGRDGLYPSHSAIAKACRYSVRTVMRALERAYQLGLVERTHRHKLVGGRWVRTSNNYQLIITAVEQTRAAGKYMARAVYMRSKHLSDRMSDKVTKNISNFGFGRRYPIPQPPQMSRDEQLAVIASWQSQPKVTSFDNSTALSTE